VVASAPPAVPPWVPGSWADPQWPLCLPHMEGAWESCPAAWGRESPSTHNPLGQRGQATDEAKEYQSFSCSPHPPAGVHSALLPASSALEDPPRVSQALVLDTMQ
jgi:hypothetical protein